MAEIRHTWRFWCIKTELGVPIFLVQIGILPSDLDMLPTVQNCARSTDLQPASSF